MFHCHISFRYNQIIAIPSCEQFDISSIHLIYSEPWCDYYQTRVSALWFLWQTQDSALYCIVCFLQDVGPS